MNTLKNMLLFIHQSFSSHCHQWASCCSATKQRKKSAVFLLSSDHKTVEVHEGKKKNPKAILNYNHNKGEVGTADEMLPSYSTKALCWSWPLVAFFNLLDIVSLNTYIICEDIFLSSQNRRQFSIKLEEKLCALERSRRHETPHLLRLKRVRDGGGEDLPPHKRTKCRICDSNKTRTKCVNCSRCVCGICSLLNTNVQRMHQFGIELSFWDLFCKQVAMGVNWPLW